MDFVEPTCFPEAIYKHGYTNQCVQNKNGLRSQSGSPNSDVFLRVWVEVETIPLFCGARNEFVTQLRVRDGETMQSTLLAASLVPTTTTRRASRLGQDHKVQFEKRHWPVHNKSIFSSGTKSQLEKHLHDRLHLPFFSASVSTVGSVAMMQSKGDYSSKLLGR